MGQQAEIVHLENQPSAESLQDKTDYAPPEIQKEVQHLEEPAWIDAQKTYLRKLDLTILPAISALYFFEYLDRGNIAVNQPNSCSMS